jgi:hypothetical protein
MSQGESERLPSDLQTALQAEVDPQEELRWCGRPHATRVVRRLAPGLVVLSLFAAAFGLMALYAAWTTRAELIDAGPAPIARGNNRPSWGAVWAMGIFGGGIMAAGLVGGPLLLAAVHREARHTVHALTNTRVLTVTLSRRGLPRTTSVEPGHPLHVTRRETRDGLGDILLYPTRGQQGATMSLVGIQHAREVERLIRTTFDPPIAPKQS